jgi:hypothetical protein
MSILILVFLHFSVLTKILTLFIRQIVQISVRNNEALSDEQVALHKSQLARLSDLQLQRS